MAFLQEMTLQQEQESKRQLVLSAIQSLSREDSEFAELAALGAALKRGDSMNCKVLSGGKTNYSYQVHLKQDPSKKVFAKLAFDYALWNPDRTVHYDLNRTVNEFHLMKELAEMMGNDAPVAQPYHLVHLDEHTMLLVTEWAPGDEQWANQFIDGHVDKRLLPKLAKALATLNLKEDFDPMFNDSARPCLLSLFDIFRDMFQATLATAESEPKDSSLALAKEIGYEEYCRMMDNMEKDYMQRDCLIHNDSHVFNLLVEKKPSPNSMKQFGENASLYICDWEMAIAGSAGSDPGKFFGYPLACAICHAMNGNQGAAYHLLDCTVEFWEAYEDILVQQGGKDKYTLANIYRQAMGWASFFLYNVFHELDLFGDTMPTEDLSMEDVARTRGAWSSLGLQFMQVAYGSNREQLSLDEYKGLYMKLVTSQIDNMLTLAAKRECVPRKNRRSSLLRSSGKRISDALDTADLIASVRRLSGDVPERSRQNLTQELAL
jgi:thiamine kinase-like enzyme